MYQCWYWRQASDPKPAFVGCTFCSCWHLFLASHDCFVALAVCWYGFNWALHSVDTRPWRQQRKQTTFLCVSMVMRARPEDTDLTRLCGVLICFAVRIDLLRVFTCVKNVCIGPVEMRYRLSAHLHGHVVCSRSQRSFKVTGYERWFPLNIWSTIRCILTKFGTQKH